MSGNQQATTSVAYNYSIYGYNGISLTNWTVSAASVIAQGSVVEVAGALFTYSDNDDNSTTTFSAIATGATAYLVLEATGSPGSQIVTSSWTSTAPTWRTDRQGWYGSAGSNIRYVGGCVKTGASSYESKFIMKPLAYTQINDAIAFAGANTHSGAESFASITATAVTVNGPLVASSASIAGIVSAASVVSTGSITASAASVSGTLSAGSITGIVYNGSIHGNVTSNQIFDAMSVFLATGQTMIVSGAYADFIASKATRTNATTITLYLAGNGGSAQTAAIQDGAGLTSQTSLAW